MTWGGGGGWGIREESDWGGGGVDTNLSLLEKIVAGFPSVSVRKVMGDYGVLRTYQTSFVFKNHCSQYTCPYKRQMIYM